MKIKRLVFSGVISLAVACVSISSVADEDERDLIILRPNEQRLMLQDMRNYLNGIQLITESMAGNDYAGVEKAAREMGGVAIYDTKPVMSHNLVPKFRRMAMTVHDDFEMLADMAKNNKPVNEMLGHLGEMMQTCVSCHETFRIGTFAHDN